MQMNDGCATGTLMQVIHILSDDDDIMFFFEGGESKVCRIRGDIGQLSSSFIIKSLNYFWLAGPSFRGGYILNSVAFPQSSCITECPYTTFSANPCTGKYNYPRHLFPLARQSRAHDDVVLQMLLQDIRPGQKQ